MSTIDEQYDATEDEEEVEFEDDELEAVSGGVGHDHNHVEQVVEYVTDYFSDDSEEE